MHSGYSQLLFTGLARHRLIAKPSFADDPDLCLPHLHSTPPLGGGSRRIIAMAFDAKKLEWFRYLMLKKYSSILYRFCRASVAYVVMRCPSVCHAFVSCMKTNKDIFEIFSLSGSPAILVFPCQTGWRYSDGNPLTEASNAGGVGKKRDSGRIYGFVTTCIQVYSVVDRKSRELWKTKPWRTASSVEPSTNRGVRLRCSHKTTTKFLWRARRYTPETKRGQTPLGHNVDFEVMSDVQRYQQ